jgi:hypothetical protein
MAAFAALQGGNGLAEPVTCCFQCVDDGCCIHESTSWCETRIVQDGRQRITSIGRFVTNKFAIMDSGNPKYFDSMPADQRAVIQNSTLLIYECEGLEKEIKDWFETINIAGVKLEPQSA